MEPRYWVGTSGYMYRHWRGVFYPEGLPTAGWLEHYAQRFPTVELNAPFYRLPRESTFQGWRARAPAGFRFAVKASRFITHIQRLRDVREPLETFLSRARLLGDKLGPVLYQLPPGLHRDDGLLEGFLALLPQDLRHTVEFRHPSWYDEAVQVLLRRYNVAFCVHDWDHRASPVVATADLAYVRFHGAAGRYAGSYSDEALQVWAQRIRAISPGCQDAFTYFNNDIGGCAVENAQTLARLLGASVLRDA